METKQENVIRTDYSEIMQKSYIDYAMSVIISRALPDVRDGLKPVQRRTLYDMYELGIRYDRPYRKCARIVGDTMVPFTMLWSLWHRISKRAGLWWTDMEISVPSREMVLQPCVIRKPAWRN